MRISVDREDPGFNDDAVSGRYVVTVDGNPVPRVITADDDECRAVGLASDPDGDIMFEDDGAGDRRPRRMEYIGNVVIKRLDEASLHEKAKYDRMYQLAEYRERCHGLELWNDHRELFPRKIRNALDIGCGTGRLMKEWLAMGIDAFGVELSVTALDADVDRYRVFVDTLWDMQLPERYDLGVCSDVMEHIPPDKVDAVLANIAASCDFVVFEIANYPSAYGDLHLTLQPADWWLSKLSQYGDAAYLPDVHRENVEEYVLTLRTRTVATASLDGVA